MNSSVSIIVPCYNQAVYLPDTIKSVVTQSYTDWECIIVNDGSPDDTEEVVKELQKLDKRIKYIKKENGGLSSARNAGIKKATGEYIQFLDADDLIEKEKISGAVSEYQRSGDDKLILYSSSRYFEHGNKEDLLVLGRNDFISHVELKKLDSLSTQNTLLRKRNLCVISAPVYPKKIFDSVGLFDENLKALEDWDLHLRCSNNGFIFHHHYVDEGNTLIRLHNNSMMRNENHIRDNWERFNAKHQILNIQQEPIKKIAKQKEVIKSLIPPILLSVYSRLKTYFIF
ncbi:MAG: glycosyltransferase [Segetibacter sp.]|nr:glycosyltransferase [Segetibacter sp.]